jgi:hypothetical protein
MLEIESDRSETTPQRLSQWQNFEGENVHEVSKASVAPGMGTNQSAFRTNDAHAAWRRMQAHEVKKQSTVGRRPGAARAAAAILA